jgi:hypothetical protein
MGTMPEAAELGSDRSGSFWPEGNNTKKNLLKKI